MQKTKFVRSVKHLKYVASQPCLICQSPYVQACHIRIGFLGLGIKPCDSKTVPLCVEHHAEQHTMNEQSFWDKYKYDPFLEAKFICSTSPCNKIKKSLINL